MSDEKYTGEYDSYTVYECKNIKGKDCGYWFRTSHGYVCPFCGSPLEKAKCIGSFYYRAQP